MFIFPRIATIVLALGLTSSLASCGFHLRGTQSSVLPAAYQSIQLQLADDAEILKRPLSLYLSNLGAKINQPDASIILDIDDYLLHRKLFSGKLTEVQLRLTVSFALKNKQGELLTEPRTVIAQRSYQYDIAGVNTEHQEEEFLVKVMQEDVAQQIARQLHANRLPQVRVDQAH